MEKSIISADELRSYEPARLKDVEIDMRRQLAELRMDIYSVPAQRGGQGRNLKRTLARILTVKTERAHATNK